MEQLSAKGKATDCGSSFVLEESHTGKTLLLSNCSWLNEEEKLSALR